MPHRTAVEEASRRRGRTISPELIEELLGSLGVGTIKSIRGLIGTGLGAKVAGKELFKPGASFEQKAALTRSRANIDRPSTISSQGRRSNVGGQRPPDAELEALALSKQKAQRIAKRKRAIRKESLKRGPKTVEEKIRKMLEDKFEGFE